ncbi:MAG: thiamine pyrophosphate-binding protein [Prolixibacteraceae bacterium]
MNVGEVIVKYLEDAGVDTVFGGSGQSDSEILFALHDSKKIKTVIPRHEQAASFMACGYAMFSDKPGVCFCTAGPGAVNLLSGLAVAYSDSLPVISIPAYTPKDFRGKGDLGESSGSHRTPDGQAMFSAVTKKSFVLEDPKQTCDVLEEALNLAFEGRPGPVNIHVDYSIFEQEVSNYRPLNFKVAPVLPAQKDLVQVAKVLAELIGNGKKVMALIGYGCIRSHAEEILLRFLEQYDIPFCTTMDAKGILPEDHRLSLGTTGISGDKSAREYLKAADAVLAVGNSFAKWSTWKFRSDIFDDKILIHINIDKHEINKVYKPDYFIVSDAGAAITGISEKMAGLVNVVAKTKLKPDKHYFEAIAGGQSKIHPARLVQKLSDLLPDNSIILGDAGANMLWLHAYLLLTNGKNFQNPGSFGPMAANVNAAIGIKYANPGRPVIVACGDGDYQMAGFELMTAVENNVPVIWIILNNGEFNIIKMFQLRSKNKEVFNRFLNPDFVLYAQACGAKGYRVEKLEDFEPAFSEALASGKPALIDVVIDPEAYPPFEPYQENK